jgi:signal transduction histidine kinase
MARFARLRHRWRTVDRRILDGAVALGLFVVLALGLAFGPLEEGASPTTAAAYVWAAGIALPYVLHRRYPMAVVAVTSVAVVGYALGHWNGFPGYSVFALVLAISLHADRRRGVIALAAGLVSMSIALALQPSGVVTAGTWVSTVLVVLVAWLVGENIRGGRERWSAMAERARRLESEREERARQAVGEERLRIARELHDVVAHSMSVIAVQAGVANHVIDSRPELARQALSTVETTARAGLVEMRRLLGVLRQRDCGRQPELPGCGGDCRGT